MVNLEDAGRPPTAAPVRMAGESAREVARRAREKSERLARRAGRWEKGAEGESRTAAELSRLGPEWTHWHDLSWPGRRFANIDHVAIGPAGIFVIDSKNWSGTIEVRDNVLRQNGYRRETAVAGCADSALAVGELIPRYLDRTRPVLCFTGEQPIEGWARDVMLCSTTNLVTMLTTRPTVLGVDEIADAVVTLRARMRSKPGPGHSERHSAAAPHVLVGRAPSVRARASSAPRNGRGRRFLMRLLAGLGCWWLTTMILVLTVGPLTDYSDDVLSPATVVLAGLSWFGARRIIT